MGLLRDVKFGLRMLIRNPLFACVVVVTLALGMGANSTVFTLVNGVFLRGLPFENPHEIVALGMFDSTRGPGRGPVSYPDFLTFHGETRSFKGLGAFAGTPMDLSDQESGAERVTGASITANTFSVLGQRPLLGRDFLAADEEPGAEPVALLGYALWQARYGGDPRVVGRSIRINLRQYSVVGVMPAGEGFPNGAQAWVPLAIQDEGRARRDLRTMQVFGRLAADVTVEQATAEVTTLAAALARSFPDTNRNMDAMVVPFIALPDQIRVVFTALQGAVGFVLLIACANVANLLLCRAVGRMRETAVRAALGAGRWQIVRQLLVESVLMSLLGGVIGLGLAALGVRLFWANVADTNPPYFLNFAMDHRVFAFFLIVCVATGILFGLAPALQMTKSGISEHLKEGGRGTSGTVRTRRLTHGLLVVEIALALVLLVGAGLMMRTFVNLQQLDLGVETEGSITARFTLRAERYPEGSDRIAFQENLLARLAASPAIRSATLAFSPPAGGAMNGPFAIEGQELGESGATPPTIPRVVVAAGYFDALGVSMLAGREFTPVDGQPGAEAVIVNAPFVAGYWPGESALGKRIRLGGPDAPWLTVVGVSRAIFQQGDNTATTTGPGVYVPYRQEPTAALSIIAYGRTRTGEVAAVLRETVRALDADLPLFNVATLDERLVQRTWPFRVFGALFVIFALIALVMASVGIYGVTAYAVGQRIPEIGLRMALGATQGSIVMLIVRQAAVPIAIGLALGLGGAWGVSRMLSGLLVGVTATDPLTFAVIPTLLATITIVASVIPARRAMRLDPSDALRV
jgi:putative ABC transport system permease protein